MSGIIEAHNPGNNTSTRLTGHKYRTLGIQVVPAVGANHTAVHHTFQVMPKQANFEFSETVFKTVSVK